MCKVLKFARSTYYKSLIKKPSKRERESKKFSEEVKKCYIENRKIYGATKIHRALIDKGISCSLKRVQRYMQKQVLRSVVIRKYKHHINTGKIPKGKENIMARDFSTNTINEKWVTDITYIYVLK